MPHTDLDSNFCLKLRASPEAKAMLLRAALLRGIDLTDFMLHSALQHGQVVIKEADVMRISVCSHRRLLDLLENPPAPNAKLKVAALALSTAR